MRVFRHETPEWIPICGHVDPWNQPSRDGMDPGLAAAIGTVRWRDESTIAYSRALGLDIMDYTAAPLRTVRRTVTIESIQQDHDTIETWHTPAGDIRQVRRHSPEQGTSYLVEHLVKGPDDLPALAAVFEDEEHASDAGAADEIARRAALIGDDGMLMCFMPGTPLGMMYRVFSSVETLAYLYADAPDALEDLFTVMEARYLAQLRLSVDTPGLDAFVGMDDTSTTVISPAMFERYDLACTDGRADICHAAGRLYFHHSCGLIRNLLPLYRRTRMDAVHAFTVPPIGDVSVAEGRRRLGDRVTIIAGVAPLADARWDPDAVKQGVARLFEGCGTGDHLILNLTAYPHKTMAQTAAVLEECRAYQRPS